MDSNQIQLDLDEISKLVHFENHGVNGFLTVADSPENNYIICIQGKPGTQTDFRVLPFQSGALDEVGVVGITNETLLAILLHRTRILDSKVPSLENKMAIEHLEQTKALFEERTRQRQQRGIVGTTQE